MSALEEATATLSDVYPWPAEPAVGIAGSDGRVVRVAGAEQGPSLQATVTYVREFLGGEWAAGDVAISNDPAVGCADVTQLTVVRAVEGGVVAARLRIPDIGGYRLGGLAPESHDVWGEGARFPALRVSVGGVPVEQARTMFVLNSRVPDLLRRGLEALEATTAELAAAVPTAEAAAAAWAQDHDCGVAALQLLRPGSYEASAPIDTGQAGAAAVVRGRLAIADGAAELDLSGSDPEIDAPVNSTASHTADCCAAELAARLPGFPATAAGLSALTLDAGMGRVTSAGPRATTALATGYTARAIRVVVSELMDAAGAPRQDTDWWERSGAEAFASRVDTASNVLSAERTRAIADFADTQELTA
ncbi:MAG TPA: hydantoinase B/oxoprolinase family protein [Conexibacter sp.]|jgi:N-methylhydantoinase B/oxoprolinase/acetone carboxylase alpha subunit|nr:hydantoinase B/oxoprolinase family protein [Conexibacter sp.]